MATYQLADNTHFDATGIVEPRESWTEGADGKRSRSGQQERNKDGVPTWNVGVTRPVVEWGRVTEKISTVVVPSPAKPAVKRHQRIRFKNLTVEVRVNRSTGQLSENFSAEGIAE